MNLEKYKWKSRILFVSTPNYKEKKYLKDYHHLSLKKLSKFLTMKERNWFRSLI